MSFRCPNCNKVHRVGKMVVLSTHEVVQYDRYHKREVRTNEIAREVRLCGLCATEVESTTLENPLGKVLSPEEKADKGWLVEAIEQAQADEVEDA